MDNCVDFRSHERVKLFVKLLDVVRQRDIPFERIECDSKVMLDAVKFELGVRRGSIPTDEGYVLATEFTEFACDDRSKSTITACNQDRFVTREGVRRSQECPERPEERCGFPYLGE